MAPYGSAVESSYAETLFHLARSLLQGDWMQSTQTGHDNPGIGGGLLGCLLGGIPSIYFGEALWLLPHDPQRLWAYLTPYFARLRHSARDGLDAESEAWILDRVARHPSVRTDKPGLRV